MAHACVGVSDISNKCGNLNLMVRVVRLWTTPSFNNASVPGSIEMVLVDKEGDKIHCSVRRHMVSRFLNVLVEGRCYKICCLAIVPNIGSYRTTKLDSRVVFHLKTTVSPVELPTMDMYGICPTPFADVLNETLNSDYLIDVIGLLIGLSQPKEYEREGKVSRMSVLELTSENLKLECALFGEYVDQMQSYVGSGDLELPIVVLQAVKIKSFRGKVGLQNVMFATRILFNPDIKEVTDFKNRFKVKIEVEDETGSGIFVMFERECSSLLRKTCAELFLENMKDLESVRASFYPSIFTELWGKKLLFKVETKVVSPYRYHGTFRVRRVCDDATVIAMFSLNGAKCTPTKAIFTPTFTPSLSLGEIESVNLGGSRSISLRDDHDGNLNGVRNYKENGTGVVYGIPLHHKKSVSVTPAKRNLEEEFEEVAGSSRNEKLKAKNVVDA